MNKNWKCQMGVKLFLDEGTSLRIIFNDGQARKYDVKNLFEKFPEFRALENRDLFLKGKLHTFSIDWTDNLDIDVVCPYYEGEPYNPGDDAIQYIVGFRVKESRIEKGLTQKDLAKLTGIDQADISKLEQGQLNPSIGLLNRIAKALNANLNIEYKKRK